MAGLCRILYPLRYNKYLTSLFVVANSSQTLRTELDEKLCPGYPDTRLLDGHPSTSHVPGLYTGTRGFTPKVVVNTREFPGIFFPKLAGIRLRRVLVG